jgi:hypothetical protein
VDVSIRGSGLLVPKPSVFDCKIEVKEYCAFFIINNHSYAMGFAAIISSDAAPGTAYNTQVVGGRSIEVYFLLL